MHRPPIPFLHDEDKSEAVCGYQNEASGAEMIIGLLTTPRMSLPASVHLQNVVSSEDDVMTMHFFQNRETVIKEADLIVLENVVKRWMEDIAFGRPYAFQGGGGPTHTSHLVQNWLSNNVNDVFFQGILASQ